MKVVMSELLAGESGVDELIAHLEREWPENIVEYILTKACALTPDQIKSFRGQSDHVYSSTNAVDAKRPNLPAPSTDVERAGRTPKVRGEQRQLRLRSSSTDLATSLAQYPRHVVKA